VRTPWPFCVASPHRCEATCSVKALNATSERSCGLMV
jgi:hypothetical protein